MSRKDRVTLTEPQKLEYAKMMIEDGYTNQQIQRYRALVHQQWFDGNGNINKKCLE